MVHSPGHCPGHCPGYWSISGLLVYFRVTGLNGPLLVSMGPLLVSVCPLLVSVCQFCHFWLTLGSQPLKNSILVKTEKTRNCGFVTENTEFAGL